MGGSSGGSSTTIDKDYNRRIAQIAEAQQRLAQEMQGYYRQYGLPTDVLEPAAGARVAPYQTAAQISQLQAGMEMMPHEMGLRRDQIQAQRNILPYDERAQIAERRYGADKFDMRRGLLPEVGTTTKQFFQSARDVDKDKWASQASADVARGFSGAEGALGRSAGRMGLGLGSGRMADAMTNLAKDRASTSAASQTQARRLADREQFDRLNQAAQFGLSI